MCNSQMAWIKAAFGARTRAKETRAQAAYAALEAFRAQGDAVDRSELKAVEIRISAFEADAARRLFGPPPAMTNVKEPRDDSELRTLPSLLSTLEGNAAPPVAAAPHMAIVSSSCGIKVLRSMASLVVRYTMVAAAAGKLSVG